MQTLNERRLASAVIALLYVAVWAGSWDVWWHGVIGRDSFWEPPHLLLYSSVIAAVALGIVGFRRFRDHRWKRIALALLLIPLSAPFDELWHRMFGVESVASPLVVWSPPHLVLIGALAFAFVNLLPVLKSGAKSLDRALFASLTFAGILGLLQFLVTPLHPIGPYALLGFWGAAFSSAAVVGGLLFARRWFEEPGGAFLAGALFFLTGSMTFGEHASLVSDVPPHGHSASWIMIAAILLTALAIELGAKRSRVLVGTLAGLTYGLILFPLSRLFIEAGFEYGTADAFIAVVASVIGGLVVGLTLKRV
ncbi:hypothetical protein IT087_04320 [Candidatus Uhrbacteria bacterium]|nr:hypothetical protein [Candidatus Uhrbacteria bacterium]